MSVNVNLSLSTQQEEHTGGGGVVLHTLTAALGEGELIAVCHGRFIPEREIPVLG